MSNMIVSDNAVKSTREGGLTFIEQLHANAVQLCPHPKVPYLTGIKDGTLYKMRGACGLWSCRVCGAMNGRKWLARILEHINHHTDRPRWYFVTITAHPKWHTSPEASVKNIRQGWKKLYNRLRRKYGVSEYVKVWEFHKDGTFHLHLLIGRKVGQRWLKDNSVGCGMGYIAHESRVKNAGQVAGYAAKYLLKSFDFAHLYPKGMRRIEASRNWFQFHDVTTDFERWDIHWTRESQDASAKQWARRNKLQVVDRRPSVEDELRAIRSDL